MSRADDPCSRYIDLLIRVIANTIYEDPPFGVFVDLPNDPEARHQGKVWPSQAHSMMGVLRLRNLADLTRRVIECGIPGNLIETGVWRGGGCILMRGILAAYDVADRCVIVADSFEGLPPPKPGLYPADAGTEGLYAHEALAVSLDAVRANFEKYGLLDEQVRFLKGYFQDTLPGFETGPLALLRLDGDMYESTIVALDALYPKLSDGGFVIVDDFGAVDGCRQAVHDYRSRHEISDPIQQIDWTGVWWQKSAPR